MEVVPPWGQSAIPPPPGPAWPPHCAGRGTWGPNQSTWPINADIVADWHRRRRAAEKQVADSEEHAAAAAAEWPIPDVASSALAMAPAMLRSEISSSKPGA